MSDLVEGATMIDFNSPAQVQYCGVCSMPPEFCEYGTCYDRCRPWIEQNCPEVLSGDSQEVTLSMSKLSTADVVGDEGAGDPTDAEVIDWLANKK